MKETALLCAVGLFLPLLACGRSEEVALETSAAAPSPSPSQLAAERAKLERARLETKAQKLVTALARSASAEREVRLEQLRALREGLADTELAQEKKYAALFNPALTKLVQRMAELDAEEKKDKARIKDIPEKPVNEPPEYDGAFQVGGIVKRCYKDGILIKSGSKYYSVLDAACPELTVVHGYVEPTGETQRFDIGRYGREAEIVKFADRETMQDDKRAHQEALREYQADYQRRLKEYNDAVRDNAALITKVKQSQRERDARRKQIWAKLDPLLVKLARQAKTGKTFTLEVSGVEGLDELQPASGSNPAHAPALAKQAPATAVAATPAAPKPQMDRRACLRKCVADCGGDANCEQRCVASKCH